MSVVSGWMVGMVAALAVPTAVFAAAWMWPIRVPEGRSVAEIQRRVRQECSEMDAKVWPDGYPHEAPDRPMAVLEAQLTMQRHRGCRVGECPPKTAAWRVLVEAGKIAPDAGRQY
ncbi:hypothetical protein [Nocardia sp. NPDC004604]|uniref:hypothetical protein n=1 Tax=Nocardia sp. NPDC004604 TaxID=3157013 RepID=UPI0033B051AC